MKNNCQKLVSTKSTEKLEIRSKNDEPKKIDALMRLQQKYNRH